MKPAIIMGSSDEEKYDHPTQKPIDLTMRRPVLNHLRRGELVYDPFLGSGTTLAAAEPTRCGAGRSLPASKPRSTGTAQVGGDRCRTTSGGCVSRTLPARDRSLQLHRSGDEWRNMSMSVKNRLRRLEGTTWFQQLIVSDQIAKEALLKVSEADLNLVEAIAPEHLPIM